MEERVLTLHPKGKKGVNISRAKYEVMRETILGCLSHKEMTATEIFNCAGKRLEGRFEGSIGWYSESVKLDLEARGVIERAKKGKAVVYRAIGQ
jgi:hypothetical protein